MKVYTETEVRDTLLGVIINYPDKKDLYGIKNTYLCKKTGLTKRDIYENLDIINNIIEQVS